MSLDAIKKSILSEATSKASGIDLEASKEAHRITKEAEDRAKEILKNAQHDADVEVERLKKEAEAGADMEANSMLLEAKGEVIEHSLKRVLADTEKEVSQNSMKRIFEQGIKQFKEISGGNFRVKTGKKNAAMLKDTAYEVDYGDIDGFMFYTDSGKVALNATVPNIVARQTDNARRLIGKEIFTGHEIVLKLKKAPKIVKAKAKKEKKVANKAKGKKRKG